MSVSLSLHGREIASVFELLGRAENDLTYSLGWALAQSPTLRHALTRRVGIGPCDDDVEVRLQDRLRRGGITDIDLIGPTMHIVVEAKRGWHVPSEHQLRRYAPRLREQARARCALVAVSECSERFATPRLPQAIGAIPVRHVSWQQIQQMVKEPAGTHAEKRLLLQLREYLERVVKMQNKESNIVYVVSVGNAKPPGSPLTFIQIVEERRRYFHPIGVRGWPKEPPNYLGFRYRGCLQSIHHVERSDVVEELRLEMPEMRTRRWSVPHFFYHLGPPIRPAREVRTGKIFRNGRVRAAFDLLLTSKTISGARDKTNKRLMESD